MTRTCQNNKKFYIHKNLKRINMARIIKPPKPGSDSSKPQVIVDGKKIVQESPAEKAAITSRPSSSRGKGTVIDTKTGSLIGQTDITKETQKNITQARDRTVQLTKLRDIVRRGGGRAEVVGGAVQLYRADKTYTLFGGTGGRVIDVAETGKPTATFKPELFGSLPKKESRISSFESDIPKTPGQEILFRAEQTFKSQGKETNLDLSAGFLTVTDINRKINIGTRYGREVESNIPLSATFQRGMLGEIQKQKSFFEINYPTISFRKTEKGSAGISFDKKGKGSLSYISKSGFDIELGSKTITGEDIWHSPPVKKARKSYAKFDIALSKKVKKIIPEKIQRKFYDISDTIRGRESAIVVYNKSGVPTLTYGGVKKTPEPAKLMSGVLSKVTEPFEILSSEDKAIVRYNVSQPYLKLKSENESVIDYGYKKPYLDYKPTSKTSKLLGGFIKTSRRTIAGLPRESFASTLDIGGGFVQGLRDKPTKTVATAAIFVAVPPILKGTGRALGPLLRGASSVFPKTSMVVSKGITYGIPIVYGGSIAYRSAKSEYPFRTFGSILSTEVAPMAVGGYIGSQASLRIEGYARTWKLKNIVRESKIDIITPRARKGKLDKYSVKEHLKLFVEAQNPFSKIQSSIPEESLLTGTFNYKDKEVPYPSGMDITKWKSIYGQDALTAMQKSPKFKAYLKAKGAETFTKPIDVIHVSSGIKKTAFSDILNYGEGTIDVKTPYDYFPGVFVAPSDKAAAAFLGLSRKIDVELYGGNIFQPYATPTLNVLPAKAVRVRGSVATNKMSLSGQKIRRFLGKDIPGVVDLPLMKTEPEGVITGSFKYVQSRFFVKVKGVRVPIKEYQFIPKGSSASGAKTIYQAEVPYEETFKSSLFTPGSLGVATFRDRISKPSKYVSRYSYSSSRSYYSSSPSYYSSAGSYSYLKSSPLSSLASSKSSPYSSYSSSYSKSSSPSYSSSTSSKSSYSSLTSSKSSSGSPSYIPSIPSYLVPSSPFLPKARQSKSKRSESDIFGTSSEYSPDLQSVLFGIKGKQPKKELYETGLVSRPMRL